MASLRRIAVRRSPVHGRGVFALRDIAAGEFVLPYAGEVVDWDEAQRRYADSDVDEGHTFFFDLGDGRVIDGAVGGNSARWINHGCDPNCEALQDGADIEIHARRDITAGGELFLDYQLVLDDDTADRAAYACACGSPSCRGTMLGG